MQDRRMRREDRRSAWIHGVPARPRPDPGPPTVPGPIPWIPTGAASEVNA
jgi:hypothetical protein